MLSPVRGALVAVLYSLPTLILSVLLLEVTAATAFEAIEAAEAQPTKVSAEGTPLRSVRLQKQYVPVIRNGKTVAYKTAYFGVVSVGSENPQSFTMVFDTGSGHFILPSTACKSETCLKHRRYNRTLSRDAVDIDSDGTPIRPDSVERDNV